MLAKGELFDMTCSLCMIVKNEQETLSRCLDSVEGLFDSIIIVDTGSIDGTKEIAVKYTDKVYDFEWIDDFSAARNYAFSLAQTDYAMWMDADDIIPRESRSVLSALLSSLDSEQPDMVLLPYCVGFDISGRPAMKYERERIIRIGSGLCFEGAIHEAIPMRGRIIRSTAEIWHLGKEKRDNDRNIRIFERMLAQGKKLVPREKYYYARELRYHNRASEAKKYYLECIKDESAWSENRASACCELADMYITESSTGSEDSKASAMEVLLKSLEFGAPRSDMCCMMGSLFMEASQPDTAVFWYSLAPSRFEENSVSFIHADYGGYIPYLSLAVIYDRKGQYELANSFNELAGLRKPDGREYLMNKEYFKTRLSNTISSD